LMVQRFGGFSPDEPVRDARAVLSGQSDGQRLDRW